MEPIVMNIEDTFSDIVLLGGLVFGTFHSIPIILLLSMAALCIVFPCSKEAALFDVAVTGKMESSEQGNNQKRKIAEKMKEKSQNKEIIKRE